MHCTLLSCGVEMHIATMGVEVEVYPANRHVLVSRPFHQRIIPDHVYGHDLPQQLFVLFPTVCSIGDVALRCDVPLTWCPCAKEEWLSAGDMQHRPASGESPAVN